MAVSPRDSSRNAPRGLTEGRDDTRSTAEHDINLSLQLGAVAAFALAAGSFILLLDWPPIVREIAVEYLVAAVLVRVAIAVTETLFYPAGDLPATDARALRILPMNDQQARF